MTLARRGTLLIDGRSGAGKSELAAAVAELAGAQVLGLDDVYPGWDGLEAASSSLPGILRQRRWRRWDWSASRYAEWHELDPARPLVVEGCGALTRATRVLADYAVWLEHPDDERRRRALERDPGFTVHWARWAVQEEQHLAREDPRSLADETLAGAAVVLQAGAVAARWGAATAS